MPYGSKTPKPRQTATAKEKDILQRFVRTTAGAAQVARLNDCVPSSQRVAINGGNRLGHGCNTHLGSDHGGRRRRRPVREPLARTSLKKPSRTGSGRSTSSIGGQAYDTNVIHHPNKRDFDRAVLPLKVETQWHGSYQHEFREIRNGKHVVHVKGQEYLEDVHVGGMAALNISEGMRLARGVFPVDPLALCARLAYFAKLFEQNKVKLLKIHYVPSVAMTEPGSIAISFSNDTFTENLEIGLGNLAVQSSKPAFVAGPVTAPMELEIDPELATKVMYDEDRGNSRFVTAGLIQVTAASDLNTDTPTLSKSYGAMFLEYYYEFITDELDQTVDLIETGPLTFSISTVTTKSGGTPVLFFFGAPGASNLPNSVDLPPMGVANLSEYLFAGTIWDTNVDASWDVLLEDDVTRHSFKTGQAVFLRFVTASNGTTYGIPYASYGRAADSDPNFGPTGNVTNTDWRWENGTNYLNPSTLKTAGRYVRISDLQ